MYPPPSARRPDPAGATRPSAGARPVLEDTTHATISIDPEEHPALKAWREFRGERVGTERIEVVTLKCREKSAVYRLVGAGPGESAVIVKRCLRTTGLIEHTIYKNVLPHLPVSAL